MLYGTKGSNLLLSTSYSEYDVGLYPRVRLYNTDGAELSVSPKDLTYVANGTYYSNAWIPSSSGYFQAVYITYSSSSYVGSSNKYGVASESIKVDDVHSDINWISSQVMVISSQIGGISLGGGATPAQIWSYTSRLLTGDTGAIKYISSQVGYISSASEKYGYGGSGKTSVAVVGGRKSPWTHQQRDEIIRNVEETKKIAEKIDKNITDYHNDELKAIDVLIQNLEVIHAKIKASSKSDTDKVLNEISYSIKVLKDNREKLKNINTINEIPNIKKNIEEVHKMTSMLLSDGMLEKLDSQIEKKEEVK
jgi:hypothetical protein